MIVIILSSLLIHHNLRYTISFGSNVFLYRTQSLGGFQILHGFAFCSHQFNFVLLLELFGGICKFKSLAVLVNEILFKLLLSHFALFFLEGHTLSHFHNETLYLGTIVTGQEEEV